MKIGIFDPYLDDCGGGEKYTMTIAEYFSKNHDVHVFWNDKDDLKKVADRFLLNLSRVKLKENIFYPKYPFLKRLVESLKYDAVIILSDGSLPLIFPRNLYIHFQQPLLKVKPSFLNSLKKVKIKDFFCNSYFTKSFIDKKFGINSKVIYPPVDLIGEKKSKENIILHVGRFRVISGKQDDYKKQTLMIKAFKEMVDKGLKNWSFLLAVGLNENDKEEFKKLEKEAHGYPIKFLINQNRKELAETYAKSKIYWHASGYNEDLDNSPELAEHFGITTVEAMSAGCVPVVIDAGGQREIVKDNQNGLLWFDLNELHLQTLKLIKDEILLNKLSKKAREFAKSFSKEIFCQKISNLILNE